MPKLVMCLCAGHFLAFVDRFLASAALSSIKTDMGLGDATLGLLIGPAFALAYVLGGLGYVALKLPSGDKAIKRGLAIWTAGECVCALAPDGLAFGVGQMAIGIGQAIFIPSALQAVVTDNIRIGGRVSLFTASSTMGRSLAVLAAGALLSLLAWVHVPEHVAWRLLYVSAACANIALFLVIPSLRSSQGSAADPQAGSSMTWLRRGGRAALWTMIVVLPTILLIQAVAAWMPTLFARSFGYSSARAATLVGFVTLLTAPTAQLFWGRIFDRWRWLAERPLAGVASFTVAAAVPVAALTIVRSPAAMLAAPGVANLLLGAAALIGLAALQMRVPPARRAAVNALFLALVTALGAGLGPLFVGMLSQSRGATAAGLADALATIALGTSVAAVLIAGAASLTAPSSRRMPAGQAR